MDHPGEPIRLPASFQSGAALPKRLAAADLPERGRAQDRERKTDDGKAEDHAPGWLAARGRARHHAGGHRRRDRAGPRQGGDRRARRRRPARHHAPARGRRAARAGDRAATRRTRWSWRATIMRMSWPRRCRTCSPARRSPSAPRRTTASITTSRPSDRGPFTEEDLPAIEAEMREIIAARRAARSARCGSATT